MVMGVSNLINPAANDSSLNAIQVSPTPTILRIHPSNTMLFPNLGNIWKSFQSYKIRRMILFAEPQASTLISGTYVISSAV